MGSVQCSLEINHKRGLRGTVKKQIGKYYKDTKAFLLNIIVNVDLKNARVTADLTRYALFVTGLRKLQGRKNIRAVSPH